MDNFVLFPEPHRFLFDYGWKDICGYTDSAILNDEIRKTPKRLV